MDRILAGGGRAEGEGPVRCEDLRLDAPGWEVGTATFEKGRCLGMSFSGAGARQLSVEIMKEAPGRASIGYVTHWRDEASFEASRYRVAGTEMALRARDEHNKSKLRVFLVTRGGVSLFLKYSAPDAEADSDVDAEADSLLPHLHVTR